MWPPEPHDHLLDRFLGYECTTTPWAGDASDAVEVQERWHAYIAGHFTEALRRLEARCVQLGPVYECEGMFVQLHPQVNV
jgi:hypothetical protein